MSSTGTTASRRSDTDVHITERARDLEEHEGADQQRVRQELVPHDVLEEQGSRRVLGAEQQVEDKDSLHVLQQFEAVVAEEGLEADADRDDEHRQDGEDDHQSRELTRDGEPGGAGSASWIWSKPRSRSRHASSPA